MLRTTLSLGVIVGVLGLCLAAEKPAEKPGEKGKGTEATITKVDPKAKTVTVKMKDTSGKDVEKTFNLTDEIRYFDSTGKAAAIDVFKSGDMVLVVEESGKLKEVHQKTGTGTTTKDTTKDTVKDKGTTTKDKDTTTKDKDKDKGGK